MASQGPNQCGTGANDNGNSGTPNWINPTNVSGAQNGSYATAACAGSGTVTARLAFSNFGFSIPEGSTILGYSLSIVAKGSADASDAFYNGYSELRIGGARVSSWANSGPTAITTSDATYTFGGATDLWNHAAATVTQINASGFGFDIMCGPSTAITISVDSATATVYYTPPGGLLGNKINRVAVHRAANW